MSAVRKLDSNLRVYRVICCQGAPPAVVTHPRYDERQMFPVINHPVAGAHRHPGGTFRHARPSDNGSVPAGEHTRSNLTEFFELDDSALNDLAARQVIFESRLTAHPVS
jgi:crotonobetainyl-CoA:carnitine CoA-transferase CaiB-like acyl-CoA transferase